MDYKQHFFMYYRYLGGSMLVELLREQEDTKGEKNRDTGLITNEGVLKKQQGTASRGTYEWEDMTWETHGQKQMMEDTHKGEQAKESDTTAEADG